MNGKRRRVRGCWSRGQTRGKAFLQPPPKRRTTVRDPPEPFYRLPTFPADLKGRLSDSQKALLRYFESYPYIQRREQYSYGSNTPGAIIFLYQHHFTHGTVRITVPGVYVLQENIVFSPNPEADFMPTTAQKSSGLYPGAPSGGYHLGFFAAIAVETSKVIIDLNGKTLKQSAIHSLQQRFYANIELANAPFIPAQGPADFSTDTTFRAAGEVLVFNGTLDLSSHHGIHGNVNSGVCLYALTISNFEVAGIALNGAMGSVLSHIDVGPMAQNILVRSTYSHSRFIRPFLKMLASVQPAATIGEKTIENVQNNLQVALDTARDQAVLNHIPEGFMGIRNSMRLLDDNAYGILLNVRGIAVNDFIKNREDTIGNSEIYLYKISIHSIITNPMEIIALSSDQSTGEAYGGSRLVGPFGDVLDITDLMDSEKHYVGTPLSDAQLIIAKYSNSLGHAGTTNIDNHVWEWAENQTAIDIFVPQHHYYVGGGDSMGHVMKGDIGLFISAGYKIKGHNLRINGIHVKGEGIGTSTFVESGKEGAGAAGILVTGSSLVTLSDTVVSKRYIPKWGVSNTHSHN